VRPAILTAFLGYVLVIVAILLRLGRPYRGLASAVMWERNTALRCRVGWW